MFVVGRLGCCTQRARIHRFRRDRAERGKHPVAVRLRSNLYSRNNIYPEDGYEQEAIWVSSVEFLETQVAGSIKKEPEMNAMVLLRAVVYYLYLWVVETPDTVNSPVKDVARAVLDLS